MRIPRVERSGPLYFTAFHGIAMENIWKTMDIAKILNIHTKKLDTNHGLYGNPRLSCEFRMGSMAFPWISMSFPRENQKEFL